MIGVRLGCYEITAKLGEGGMGSVWRATDTSLGRDVALKLLPDDFADDDERHARFEREVRILERCLRRDARLRQPDIASVRLDLADLEIDDCPYDLYAIEVGGTRPERLPHASSDSKFPYSISPDGRFLLYTEEHEKTGIDLMLMRLDGEPEPKPFITTSFNQPHGVFSPDGRWVAYSSSESGHMEVYATPFPGPGHKWQLSMDGGTWPQWRGDGQELYYRSPAGTLFAMPLEVEKDSLVAGTPRSLGFSITTDGSSPRCTVSADGSRFLSIDPVAAQGQPPLTVVLNWTARLSR